MKHLLFLLFGFLLVLSSCDDELVTSYKEETCKPQLFNPQYSFQDIAGNTGTLCSSGAFSNSFRVFMDVKGCIDTSYSIIATINSFNSAGVQLGSSSYAGQWNENLNGKIFFGYCYNFASVEYLELLYYVQFPDGDKSNELRLIVPRPQSAP